MRNLYASIPVVSDIFSSSGDREHIIYSPIISPDGSLDLKESGREDIQLLINSHAASCDISLIIARLNAGDTSVINVNTPSYGDFTQFPKTMAEAMQLCIRAETDFSALPVDVRAAYDNNYMLWFADSGSSKWSDLMSKHDMITTRVDKVVDKFIKEVDEHDA